MLYAYTLTIPANTPASAPVSDRAKMTHGVITRVEVEFPLRCAGQVYCHIDDALHQVWPTNEGATFRSDGRAIIWADYLELFEEPYDLQLVGYNLDDTFQHEVLFRFEVTPREIAEASRGILAFINGLRSVFGGS